MAKDAPENELCFYSSCSGKSLLNSDVLFNTFPRKKPGAKDDSSCHLNLIYFCGAVQALGLDFLPIYWQPQNGFIGGGGTSRVHQSLLNLELSLAFKAIDVGDISRARTGDDVERIYSLLLAEIQHMGWKPILNSPYIHKVEGVCWSLNKSTGGADPVLVFEKAPHGDMYHYMTCGKGKSLDLSDRLRMCRDVAIGLETLHDCNIIHGDIKPQNVLLMDFDGLIVPQVTDFGYSTAYTSSDSPIIHSRTVPWNAPEVGTDSKAYTPTDAIRTDTFSFGMFCLWVLFREQVADHFGLTQDFVDQCKPSESNISSSFRAMTNLKNQDQLRPFCQILVRSLQLEPSQRESLEQLFEATLSPQPSERADSFKLLCKCLDSSLTNKASNKAIPAVDLVGHMNGRGASGQHFDFEISESALQFLRCDLRVREYITKSLFDQAQQATCFSCRSNAAFQLSVCLSIGFGIAANDASALEWLRRSGRSQIELDQQLARMAQWSQASEPWLYHTTYLNNLNNNGYLSNIDYFGIYMSDYPWDTIKESYQREITDLSARLGPQSILPLFLRLVYALLLRNAGHYEEASSIQEHSLHYLQSNPGIVNYLDTQAIMSELAETHRRQGNFDQAMRYCEEVIAERNRVFGLGHPQMLACLHLKARLLQQKGSDQEAEMMYKTLINQRQSTLGKYHVDTLHVMSDLGSLYLVQKRYDEALSLVDEELQLTEHLFGPYHYSTLTSLNNLGAVHFEMGDPSRAQGLLDLVLFRLRLTLGPEHPSTCTVLANCGSMYRKLEKYKESLSCYDEALVNVEKLLGRGHPRALEVVLAKAMLLVEAQGDFDEIHGLFQRCVQGREKAFGESHPEVLEVLQYYSLFLTQREKFDQAEQSYRLLLLRQESSLGAHNEALVPTLSNLGEVLSQLAREDAGDMYRRAFRLASELDGEEELTWTCMRNLARYLHEFGSDMEEVEKLYRLVVDSQRANSWEQGLDNGEDLDSLTQVLFEQGKFQEAEAIQRELLILTQALPDQDHVDWIEKIATLALILSRQGKFSEAERYYLEAFNMSAEAAGEDEVRTLDLSRELAWTMERGGKCEQARLRALEALQKSKARYGMLHPLHLRVKAVAAAIHFRQGDRAAAIDLNDEVVRGSLRVFGAESEEVQAAEANQAIYAKQ